MRGRVLPPPLPLSQAKRSHTTYTNLWVLGCHDNGYVSALNSLIFSGHTDKLVLLPGYIDMAVGIARLGLPSVAIPDLFLAEKISLFPVQQMRDRSRTPSPSPPTTPPYLSSYGTIRPIINPQNVKESYTTPVRRGSDPGSFNRTVIEGVANYKSAVQARMFGGGDGYTKCDSNPTKGPPSPRQSGNWEGGFIGGDYGSPARRINPKIVELIKPLPSLWKQN